MDMRQLRTRVSRPRLFLVVVATSALALAASSPIYSAVSGGHVIGHTSASPVAPAGGTAAKADCSKATARQLVEQHHLNDFLLPNPVRQLLCGPFTGPGSEAMAMTIAAPTCWSPQRWAVFSFTSGAWQLVLDQRRFIFPLVAVGADIRETAPVFRQGDPHCIPSGGTHARTWHWDGTRLTAGPWKQVTKGEPKRRWFFSPSGYLSCAMGDDSRFRAAACQSLGPPKKVTPQKVSLNAAGRLTICRGSVSRCKLGNAGEAPTLGYGRQITVGRFRCRSQRSGVRCTVIRSGKGFLISRDSVRRVGP
jgi:hypothetical protein